MNWKEATSSNSKLVGKPVYSDRLWAMKEWSLGGGFLMEVKINGVSTLMQDRSTQLDRQTVRVETMGWSWSSEVTLPTVSIRTMNLIRNYLATP